MGPGCKGPAQRQANKDADRGSNEYRHDTAARNLFHDVRSRRPEGNTHSKFPPALSDEVRLNAVEPGYRENQREDRKAKEEVRGKALSAKTIFFKKVSCSDQISHCKCGIHAMDILVDCARSASGGTLPYAWSLTGSQQLPSGLSLNASTGVISGTPTTTAGRSPST
jgi:Putative Ig domain